jgi:hypothetical protein
MVMKSFVFWDIRPKEHVPVKCQLTFMWYHGILSQKIEHIINHKFEDFEFYEIILSPLWVEVQSTAVYVCVRITHILKHRS